MPSQTHNRRAQLGAALLLAAVAAAPAVAQTPSLRAYWADAFSVGFKSNAQVTDMVNRAVAGRYNAIFVEVVAFHDNVGSGHGAYYNSAIVPRASDIPGGFDPLATVVAQAHAAGIEVHAWIVPYRVSSTWPPAGNALLAAHPEWLMVPLANMGNGPAQVGGYYTLDPGSPDAQEYLIGIVRELVTNYAIDGINLDYIRYVQTDAGYPADTNYADSSLARFRALTGYVGTPAPTGVTAWNDFRRRTIDEYVRRLRAEIPAITSNPRQPLRFTADLIVFGNAPANFESSSAYTLHQNWRMWMQNGWLDAGVPMNYKREHNSNEASWYRNWVTAANNWRFNRHMVMGQAPYLNTKANSVTQLAYALNAGCHGVCTFSYDATADENRDGTPETDWTWYTYVASNLFTQVAPTPAMPWRNPATATEGTLWGRVIDDASGLPVDGATVQVGALPSVLTDGNGYYTVTLIPATAAGTNYTVTATGLGCPPVNAAGVTVFAGGLSRRDFLLCEVITPPAFGDMDEDGDVDLNDLNMFIFCLRGPGFTYVDGNMCLRGDGDADRDVDMHDFSGFQRSFGE